MVCVSGAAGTMPSKDQAWPCLPCEDFTFSTYGVSCQDCPSGFKSSEGRVICEDIDECRFQNGGCDVLATANGKSCQNTVGSFSCGMCPDGFELIVSLETVQFSSHGDESSKAKVSWCKVVAPRLGDDADLVRSIKSVVSMTATIVLNDISTEESIADAEAWLRQVLANQLGCDESEIVIENLRIQSDRRRQLDDEATRTGTLLFEIVMSSAGAVESGMRQLPQLGLALTDNQLGPISLLPPDPDNFKLVCPAGTGLSEQKVCTACPPGRYAPRGSTTCFACDVGQYSKAESQECQVR
jgi:hypothetical protein